MNSSLYNIDMCCLLGWLNPDGILRFLPIFCSGSSGILQLCVLLVSPAGVCWAQKFTSQGDKAAAVRLLRLLRITGMKSSQPVPTRVIYSAPPKPSFNFENWHSEYCRLVQCNVYKTFTPDGKCQPKSKQGLYKHNIVGLVRVIYFHVKCTLNNNHLSKQMSYVGIWLSQIFQKRSHIIPNI